MRFLRGVVAVLAMLYPATCYLLALSVGGLDKWVCLPLFLSSAVHVCWLFHFCAEEWLDFGTAMFVVPMATTFCLGLYFTTSYFSGGVLAVAAPAVIQCALLTLCSLLPYGIGFAVRKMHERNGIFPTFRPASPLVIGIFAFVIATPILILIAFFAVEIYYASADLGIGANRFLATPKYALEAQWRIYQLLFYTGLPLGILGRCLFLKQSKPKENPFTYH